MKIVILISISLLMWSTPVLSACLNTITPNTPTTDFIINTDGTVTHKKTKLTWKRCSEGQGWNGTSCTGIVSTNYNWRTALIAAFNLNAGTGFATHKDWRVPNIKELYSIVEDQCVTPTINSAVFLGTGNWYWSSSPDFSTTPNVVWGIFFDNGNDMQQTKTATGAVRLVRGGQ